MIHIFVGTKAQFIKMMPIMQSLDARGIVYNFIDAGQHAGLTMELINQFGLALLGYERDELLGRNWFEACLPERMRAPVRHTFDQIMAGRLEAVEFYENPVLARDGSEHLIAWHNAYLVDESGAALMATCGLITRV